MKKPLFVAIGGIILVIILFFGFSNAGPKKAVSSIKTVESLFNVKDYIDSSKRALSASQTIVMASLENNVKRGDVQSQQVASYISLANFWKDSGKLFEPYAFYIAEAAKLENSEKKLTFAAQIFLNNLRWEKDAVKLKWETDQAISLFEKALELNPGNPDLKIGLGSSYIFGRGGSGNPQETMKGIQTLLSVVREDSTNMKAQMMLGIGGFVSGQYDKAIERLQKVVIAQPQNLEAVAFLADTYASKGDKTEALKWYNISKRLVNDPHYSKEVDERVKMLK
ncbi:MAG: tetratricopeptide repeat protein [Ferruginibacter sp.]